MINIIMIWFYLLHTEIELNIGIDPIIDFAVDFEEDTFFVWTIEGTDEYGDWIRLYENGHMVYENDFSKVKPWCIYLGNFDEDLDTEVLVGTYNKAPFRDIAKRPFVFNWNGEVLSKQWTGSYLSPHELMDLSVKDIDDDGKEEIISKEVDEEGNIVSYVYHWFDFGFYQDKYNLNKED